MSSADVVGEDPVEVVLRRVHGAGPGSEAFVGGSSSFEAGIADAVVVLAERPCGMVRWDKEIGLPATNAQEDHTRLKDAADALITLRERLKPGADEQAAALDGDSDEHNESHPGQVRHQ